MLASERVQIAPWRHTARCARVRSTKCEERTRHIGVYALLRKRDMLPKGALYRRGEHRSSARGMHKTQGLTMEETVGRAACSRRANEAQHVEASIARPSHRRAGGLLPPKKRLD